jgi:plasmid stabilization system protein ParE
MAIKIAARGGRLRRQNPTDRDASNIRVNTEAFDALFRTRNLVATAGSQIDYSQLTRLADKIASDVQGIEDNRVDAENQSIAANVNKELNDKFLELASNPTIGIAEYAKVKETAQAEIIAKYKTKFEDAPSRQYEKLKPHLSNEFEKFRLKLNSDYLNKSKQFIVKTTMKGLDTDKNNLSKAITIEQLGFEYYTQRANYNKNNSPFFILNGYGLSSTLQDDLLLDHSVTAIKKAAALLLIKDPGKAGEAYRASDANRYYGQDDYTKVNNYISNEENQKIIADYLGLDLTKKTDKDKFKATISVLREDIKKQEPFVEKENAVHNNNINNAMIELIRGNDIAGLMELLKDNPFRGDRSAEIYKVALAYATQPDAQIALKHNINKDTILMHILANPDEYILIFTKIPGLLHDKKPVSAFEAVSLGLITPEQLITINDFINTNPNQRRVIARNERNKTETLKAVRKTIENFYASISPYADATWKENERLFNQQYSKAIQKGISHNDALQSDTDTLQGLSSGNPKSIFYNAVNIFKPSLEDSRVTIDTIFDQQTDLDILSSQAGIVYIELLRTKNPVTGKVYTQAEVDAMFLKEYQEEPYILKILLNLKKAIERLEDKVED